MEPNTGPPACLTAIETNFPKSKSSRTSPGTVRKPCLERSRTINIWCDRKQREKPYLEFYRRCRRLAGRGIGPGAVVAVMAPNVPAILEAHFGVPMAGAVLNPLNVRLDAPAIAEILEHGGAQAVICDRAYGAVMTKALGRLGRAIPLIAVDDDDGSGGELPGEIAYEELLEEGDPDFEWRRPGDEWQAISLNYTSGTTGAPKGMVYHHRGAYLNALGNALAWSLPAHPVYLWTLPMFHCNGWCFPWTVTALAGTHVCLRQVEPDAIFAAIERTRLLTSAAHRLSSTCWPTRRSCQGGPSGAPSR